MRSCDYNMRLLRHRGAGEHREISHGDTETQRSVLHDQSLHAVAHEARIKVAPGRHREGRRAKRDQPRRHRDTEVVLYDQSLHAVAHEARIKVDQQPDTLLGEAKICEHLCVEDRVHAFDAFDLDNHEVLNDEVNAVLAQQPPFVDGRQSSLALVCQTCSVNSIAIADLYKASKRPHRKTRCTSIAQPMMRSVTVLISSSSVSPCLCG